MEEEKWLKWAIELQALAQTGLEYSENKFDIERFERIREISAEIISYKTDTPLEKVKDVFCKENGYQTPKIETRAAIFKDEKILLVQEEDGKWSLPGGWCDVDRSIRENIIKESKEEAGMNVEPIKIIAIHDRKKHNKPEYIYNICKIFVLCEGISGEFKKNNETLDAKYFAIDEIENLSEDKNNMEQIKMCFNAKDDNNWKVQFD